MPDQWQKSKTIAEASRHAWDGVRGAFTAERNFRVQLIVFGAALLLGWLLGLPASGLAMIMLAGTLVGCLELINTALENLSNVVSPAYQEVLRGVKDMAAGAVLLGSIGAVLVGLLLFIPALL